MLACRIDPKTITPLLHLSHLPLPSPSLHLVSQLLRDFDRESRLGDLFEGDFAIGETALGLDRTMMLPIPSCVGIPVSLKLF